MLPPAKTIECEASWISCQIRLQCSSACVDLRYHPDISRNIRTALAAARSAHVVLLQRTRFPCATLASKVQLKCRNTTSIWTYCSNLAACPGVHARHTLSP